MRRRLQDVRIKQVDDPPAGPSEVLLRLRIVRLVGHGFIVSTAARLVEYVNSFIVPCG